MLNVTGQAMSEALVDATYIRADDSKTEIEPEAHTSVLHEISHAYGLLAAFMGYRPQ